MKVVLFTDHTSEYYIYPLKDNMPELENSATIDLPEALYRKWLGARKAYRDVHYEIEQVMHKAVYEDG